MKDINGIGLGITTTNDSKYKVTLDKEKSKVPTYTLSMKQLSDLGEHDKAEVIAGLRTFVTEYIEWIDGLSKETFSDEANIEKLIHTPSAYLLQYLFYLCADRHPSTDFPEHSYPEKYDGLQAPV